MTKIETVVRQLSDLRDFYLKIQKIKKEQEAEKDRNRSGGTPTRPVKTSE